MKRSILAILSFSLVIAACAGAACSSAGGGGSTATSTGESSSSGATDDGGTGDDAMADGSVEPPVPWTETHITAEGDEGQRVSIDGAGNVLAAFISSQGDFSAEVDTLTFEKLSPKGVPLWKTTFNGDDKAVPMGIVADAAGDVFVAGVFQVSGTIGGQMLSASSEYDMFVAKLSGKDGALVWAKAFGGLNWDWVNDITTDGTDLFLVGSIGDSLSFGGAAIGPGGFAARLKGSDGAHVWSFGWPSAQIEVLTLDAKKNVWLGGSISATVTFGATKLTPIGNTDALLVKLSPNGDVLHAASYGGGWYDKVWDLATDAADDIIVVGEYGPSASFGGPPLGGNEIGMTVGFAAKYDAMGNHLWSRRVQEDAQGVPTRLSPRTSPEQFVAISGQFYGPRLFTFDGAGKTVMTSPPLDPKVSAFDVAAFGDKGVAVAGRWEATAVVQGKTLTAQGATDGFVTYDP